MMLQGQSYVSRYAYNSLTQRCESFTYGGCNGNLNNFQSEADCITACSNVVQRPTCPQVLPHCLPLPNLAILVHFLRTLLMNPIIAFGCRVGR